MELRRAILLFAIVLGLAAVATSLSRPLEPDNAKRTPRGATRPTANPRPGDGPVTKPVPPIVFEATRSRPETRSLKAGRAATVSVKTEEAGEVSVRGLGLLAYSDPQAPALLDVLSTVPDRYEVRFTPTAGGEIRTVGYLRVTP